MQHHKRVRFSFVTVNYQLKAKLFYFFQYFRPLIIEVIPEWAPLGANRFLELVRDGFYTDIAFFRCVDRFLTQFGISENPKMKHWHNANMKDDPNTLHLPISKHIISYAGGGPNTRSTQLFIAFEDLDFLGKV
jgi:peptidyl-prolyl cis-trans isomerase A (cyclophilin A)